MELKASETYRDAFARHLRSVGDELGLPPEGRMVIYCGSERYDARGVSVVPAKDALLDRM